MSSAISRNADLAVLLNEYCPNSMLWEEVVKKDYFLNKLKKDEKAFGSKIIVPFMSATESSVRFGKLTAEADIAQVKPVRGELEGMVEVYGSLIFNHADLVDQEGRIPESTFFKVFPGAVERMTRNMREIMSMGMMNGASFATATDSTNAATGIYIVDHPERFQLGQKCSIDDGDSSPKTVYVIAVDYNTKAVTFSDARGSTAYNLGAYTTAQTVKFYHDGVIEQGTYNNLKSILLSAANGGSANLHGKAKVSYGSFLQAMNVSGAAISSTNILEKIFDAWMHCKIYGKCTGDTVLMNLKHMGSVMKIMEDARGAYTVIKSENKPLFGWWETEIAASKTGQTLKLVGLQEIDTDFMPIVDFNGFTLRSKGGLRKMKQPDGSEFYTTRTETGYSSVIDLESHAQLECSLPGQQAIIHTISY